MDFLKSKFEQQISASVEEDFEDVHITTIFGDKNFEVKFSPAQIVKGLEKDTYDLAFNEWKSRYIREQLERAEAILSRFDNRNVFQRLKNVVGSTSIVIPFVGAGMSCESGFLGWQEYLWYLQADSGVAEADLQALLDSGRFEEAADLLLADFGEILFEFKLQTTYTSFDGLPINGAINYLPLLFTHSVITTNFDNLLERVYQSANTSFDEVLKGKLGSSFNRHLAEGRRCLLKLHGHYSEPGTRVLTKAEYDSVYNPPNGVIEALKAAFKSHTFLFLGCSLDSDRTMKVMKDIVDADKEAVPSHFAFLPAPTDDAIRRAKERLLAERKIFPIWYPDGEHEISIDALFIRMLSEIGMI